MTKVNLSLAKSLDIMPVNWYPAYLKGYKCGQPTKTVNKEATEAAGHTVYTTQTNLEFKIVEHPEYEGRTVFANLSELEQSLWQIVNFLVVLRGDDEDTIKSDDRDLEDMFADCVSSDNVVLVYVSQNEWNGRVTNKVTNIKQRNDWG